MYGKNCKHNAPEDYCPKCNTEKQIESRFGTLLECDCLDGKVLHHEYDGDWEEPCKVCNGTGMLNKEQSLQRHKFLKYYWERKINKSVVGL